MTWEQPSGYGCIERRQVLWRLLDPTSTEAPVGQTDADAAVRAAHEAWLRCGVCGARVTSRPEAIEVQGQHAHDCTNPHGLVFRIGCFRHAPGCRPMGEATERWSWFKGYRWRVALCRACGEHLGWAFEGGLGAGFYGLILTRLHEEH